MKKNELPCVHYQRSFVDKNLVKRGDVLMKSKSDEEREVGAKKWGRKTIE